MEMRGGLGMDIQVGRGKEEVESKRINIIDT